MSGAPKVRSIPAYGNAIGPVSVTFPTPEAVA